VRPAAARELPLDEPLDVDRLAQPQQVRQAVSRAVLLARRQHRIEHQPQVAHHEAVQHVARPPRLVRVVAPLRTLLIAVQRLDRCVQVQHPGPIQRIAHAVHQRLAHPALGRFGLDRLQCAARRGFADQPRQAQCPRRHRVALDPREVRVALTSGQDAQHQRVQHVALGAAVGAR
jgi:hypothetical protein